MVWSATTAIEGHTKPNFFEKYSEWSKAVIAGNEISLAMIEARESALRELVTTIKS